MRIAIIGAGRVGKALGAALGEKGHFIAYGVTEPRSLGDITTKTVDGAIEGADVVILAVPWTAAEALVCEHAPALAGKVVIDATNPLNTSATRLALGFDTSGVEFLQSQAQGAAFFKAFNTAGVDAIARPRYPEGRAAMFVAGPDGPEKKIVLGLASDVGFEAVDIGELRAARLLEPLSMLRLHLAETKGRGRDFAFLLAFRERSKPEVVHPYTLVKREAQQTS